MSHESSYNRFNKLCEINKAYFNGKFGQGATEEQVKNAAEFYKKMVDFGIQGMKNNHDPNQKFYENYFGRNWKQLLSEAICLMHDEIFTLEEVAKLYVILEEIGKVPKSGLYYSDKQFVHEFNYCTIHLQRLAIPEDKIIITDKQNQHAMESLKKLLRHVFEKVDANIGKINAEEEPLRRDFERWLIYYYKWVKSQIEHIIRKQVGNDEDRSSLLASLAKMKQRVQQWVPLSYRIFGLPCGIDGGPLGNEKTDLTMMTEDVELISQFFEERENRHEATPGLRRKHLENKDLQPNNQNFPASALFNNMDEVRELLASRYFPYNNGSRFHDYRCCSLLADRTQVFAGNGTVFVYITGHGLSSALADGLTQGLLSLGEKYPQYKRYLVAQSDHGKLRDDELLEVGQIIAFTKFIGIQDFLIDFLEICRTNQQEESESPYFKPEPEKFQQRHLIIVVDACFSGNWIKDNIADQFKTAYIENTNISITIQTSTNKLLPSYGYFFTPLFVKLQTLDENDLNKIFEEFDGMSEESKSEYPSLLQSKLGIEELSVPQFCHYRISEAERKLHKDETNTMKAYVTVQNLRFFVNPIFFAFFAHKFMDSTLGPDIDSLKPEPRPLLDSNAGEQFLEKLTQTKDIEIRGIKLTTFLRDGTPLCIVAVRSPTNTFVGKNILTNSDEYWYHLHVHFDGMSNGQVSFPGNITHIKLVYAVQSSLNFYEEGIFVDASRDNKIDYQNMEKERETKDLKKRDAEFFIGNWSQYRDKVKACLTDWSQKQPRRTFLSKGEKLGSYIFMDIWRNKKIWYKLEPVQFGSVLVRDRSLITKKINSSKVVDRVTLEFSGNKYLDYKPPENKSKQESQVITTSVDIYTKNE
ncbi:unnamed protein product [Rotaria socialis]|uniref:Uncharacterized protein n=1 Tax=Rotaria socialis TaxID=392032 RepID=A0A817UUH3_9BILA|nr:unnamed protein product [Rotaria socialis]